MHVFQDSCTNSIWASSLWFDDKASIPLVVISTSDITGWGDAYGPLSGRGPCCS